MVNHSKQGDIFTGLQLVVRDSRFARHSAPRRWWLNDDPVATAWFNALSLSFPRGEAMFIAAVKQFRDDAPPELKAQIRDFVRQEVNHSREHLAFNRAVEDAGYETAAIDARVESLVNDVFALPPIAWLGITMALEHFTAMFAHEFLANPRHFYGSDVEQAQLWQWHAVEEIEHKAVAHDTWLHATRGWSRWKRWSVKSALMLRVTSRFIRNRMQDAEDLLAQDGITGWRAKGPLLAYLFVKPGILLRMLPAWASYFLPGFHPWKLDNRELIDSYDRDREGVAAT